MGQEEHTESPEPPEINQRTRLASSKNPPPAKASTMATDVTRRSVRPRAQTPIAEPKLQDVVQYLQEMEMRYNHRTQKMMETLRAEMKGLTEQNSRLMEGNAKLAENGKAQAEEIKRLTDQLNEMTATITSLEKTVSSQSSQANTRSYASAASSPHLIPPTIAVTPPNSSPALSSISNPNTTRTIAREKHRLPCVELNLGATQVSGENAKELQELMNMALQATTDLTQVKCTAVMNRRKERVSFVFASDEQARIIRDKEPWKSITEKDFNQARPIIQERFKVKLMNVDKQLIGNPDKGEAITESIVNQINDENGLTIQTIRLLSQPSDRRTVQLVMVCASQEEKDSVLSRGYIAVQGALAHTSEFFESQVLQCRKCGEFNHMARNCGNSEKCLNCNEQGHSATTCTNPSRCCNCHGKHHSQAMSCPVRQRQTQNRRPNEW
jgi:uncharacterized protein YoxC